MSVKLTGTTVTSLKRQLKVQTTTLLSSDSTRHILQNLSQDAGLLRLPHGPGQNRDKVIARSKAQEAYNQQCLYRTCATITTFKVCDPDPNAVDSGNVLGVRIEIMKKAMFLKPYYVLLNRPYPGSRHLRVHRHTVPAYIPLSGLAARYLPAPKPADSESQSQQDLALFVRSLRREVVRYHNRAAVVADLQNAVGLGEKKEGKQSDSAQQSISDILADAETKQASLTWTDGRTGRLVMDDDGRITKLVVFGAQGRDRETARELMEDGLRLEDVAKRLQNSRRDESA
jgi:central kinetochore subunit Mal2/MCM21